VLSKARHYLQHEVSQQFKNWYLSLVPTQGSVFSPDRCCFSIGQGQIQFVHVRKQQEKAEILLCETFSYEQLKEIKTILSRLVQQHQLTGVRSTWILQSPQYQLLQTETLPVSPQEFQAAIRWKVKDLLGFPIEDAIIDHFALPKAKLPTSLELIMLVVARISQIEPISQLIAASGLKLATIDIPELSFRNLTSGYEQDEKTTVMIYLQQDYSQLIMTNQQKLYFSRHLGINLQKLKAISGSNSQKQELNQLVNETALDLQRSFDYYQSQWRQPEPARLLFGSAAACSEDFVRGISQGLNIEIQKFALDRYFTNTAHLDLDREGGYLPLLGGIIREWGQSYAAGN